MPKPKTRRPSAQDQQQQKLADAMIMGSVPARTAGHREPEGAHQDDENLQDPLSLAAHEEEDMRAQFLKRLEGIRAPRSSPGASATHSVVILDDADTVSSATTIRPPTVLHPPHSASPISPKTVSHRTLSMLPKVATSQHDSWLHEQRLQRQSADDWNLDLSWQDRLIPQELGTFAEDIPQELKTIIQQSFHEQRALQASRRQLKGSTPVSPTSKPTITTSPNPASRTGMDASWTSSPTLSDGYMRNDSIFSVSQESNTTVDSQSPLQTFAKSGAVNAPSTIEEEEVSSSATSTSSSPAVSPRSSPRLKGADESQQLSTSPIPGMTSIEAKFSPNAELLGRDRGLSFLLQGRRARSPVLHHQQSFPSPLLHLAEYGDEAFTQDLHECERMNAITERYAELRATLDHVGLQQKQAIERRHGVENDADKAKPQEMEARLAAQQQAVHDDCATLAADNEGDIKQLLERHAVALMETYNRHRRDQDAVLNPNTTITTTEDGRQTVVIDEDAVSYILDALLPLQEEERNVLRDQHARELAKYRIRQERASDRLMTSLQNHLEKTRTDEQAWLVHESQALRLRHDADLKWFSHLHAGRVELLSRGEQRALSASVASTGSAKAAAVKVAASDDDDSASATTSGTEEEEGDATDSASEDLPTQGERQPGLGLEADAASISTFLSKQGSSSVSSATITARRINRQTRTSTSSGATSRRSNDDQDSERTTDTEAPESSEETTEESTEDDDEEEEEEEGVTDGETEQPVGYPRDRLSSLPFLPIQGVFLPSELTSTTARAAESALLPIQEQPHQQQQPPPTRLLSLSSSVSSSSAAVSASTLTTSSSSSSPDFGGTWRHHNNSISEEPESTGDEEDDAEWQHVVHRDPLGLMHPYTQAKLLQRSKSNGLLSPSLLYSPVSSASSTSSKNKKQQAPLPKADLIRKLSAPSLASNPAPQVPSSLLLASATLKKKQQQQQEQQQRKMSRSGQRKDSFFSKTSTRPGPGKATNGPRVSSSWSGPSLDTSAQGPKASPKIGSSPKAGKNGGSPKSASKSSPKTSASPTTKSGSSPKTKSAKTHHRDETEGKKGRSQSHATATK